MRILYVEDNEVNRALVERVMRARQCSVVFQDEGEGALEALAKDPTIDLILLDIELAGTMTGLDVIKSLRARNDLRPVVAVTAYAMMGDRERILEAGCDQYLPKPLVVTDLLNVIDHYQGQLAAKASPKTAEEAAAPTPAAPATPTTESPVPPPAEAVPASEPTPSLVQAAPSQPADAKPVESPTPAAPTPAAAGSTPAASASPTPGTAERPALAITPAPDPASATPTAPVSTPTPSSGGAQPVDQQEKVAVEDKESS
jgi:two-component system cell cycle response regulator DivK